MEYCITILVESLDYGQYQKPIEYETAWGSAVRVNEENKLFWKNEIWLTIIPPVDFLLSKLPPTLRSLNWIWLEIGNDKASYSYAINNYYDNPLVLMSLIEAIISSQTRWAVFFQRDCSQMQELFATDYQELLQLVAQIFDYTSHPAKGFCAYCQTSQGKEPLS